MKTRTHHRMRKNAARDDATPPWLMSPQKDAEDDREYREQDASPLQANDDSEQPQNKSAPDTDEQGDPKLP